MALLTDMGVIGNGDEIKRISFGLYLWQHT